MSTSPIMASFVNRNYQFLAKIYTVLPRASIWPPVVRTGSGGYHSIRIFGRHQGTNKCYKNIDGRILIKCPNIGPQELQI